jgi:protein transport protein SEC13
MDIEGNWQLESTLEGHSDWVRDVKWAPNVGLSSQTIASCSQDKTCILWVQQAGSTKWEKKLLKAEKFPEALWRVSWSLAGNLLAVSGGDNKVYLFKQKLDGSWEQQSELEEPSNYQHQ